MDKLNSGITILIPDVSLMPPEAKAEKSLLESLSISSAVAIPVRGNTEVIGFIGIDNVLNTSGWTEKDLSVLRMSAEIIGSAIERHDAAEELSILNTALSGLNAQLEERVNERTHQLGEAVAAANAANQAKSDFLTSMSHELRTPLNAVIGFSQVLQEQLFGPLTSKQAQYISYILSSGQHLLSLIDDILDLSKIEAGKSQMEFSSSKIGPLINDSLLMVKEGATNKHIDLRTLLSPAINAADLEVDSRKVKQVLFNLLSNAVKFTPDGGKITVKGHRKNGRAVISVSDTGIGIPPEAQSKLFNDFYQVQGGISKTPGTGLGLAISRRLVEMHGGRIWVESKGIGNGSRFKFEIPVKRGNHSENGACS